MAYREPHRNVVDVTRVDGCGRGRAGFCASRPIWLVSWATFLFAAVQVSWISYAPLYLSEVVGLSALGAGVVLGLAQTGGILGRVGFGILSDRLLGGRRLGVLLGAGVASGVLCLATGALAPGTAAGLARAGRLRIRRRRDRLERRAPHPRGRDRRPRLRGDGRGLCLAVSSLGVIAGAPLVGAVADRLGTYGPGWVGLAGAMGLAVVLLLGVREPAGRGWQ